MTATLLRCHRPHFFSKQQICQRSNARRERINKNFFGASARYFETSAAFDGTTAGLFGATAGFFRASAGLFGTTAALFETFAGLFRPSAGYFGTNQRLKMTTRRFFISFSGANPLSPCSLFKGKTTPVIRLTNFLTFCGNNLEPAMSRATSARKSAAIPSKNHPNAR
jgi:hypothetical protein